MTKPELAKKPLTLEEICALLMEKSRFGHTEEMTEIDPAQYRVERI